MSDTPNCPACGSTNASPSPHGVPGEYFCSYDGCVYGVWQESAVAHLRSELAAARADYTAMEAQYRVLMTTVAHIKCNPATAQKDAIFALEKCVALSQEATVRRIERNTPRPTEATP